MKRILTLGTLAIFFVMGFSACEKIEIGKDVPQCIKKKIRKDAGPCLGNVIEYIETPEDTKKTKSRIYRFNRGSLDCYGQQIPSVYNYDEQCNPIEVTINYDIIESGNKKYIFNRVVYQYYRKK